MGKVTRGEVTLVDLLTNWPVGQHETALVDLLISWPVGQSCIEVGSALHADLVAFHVANRQPYPPEMGTKKPRMRRGLYGDIYG